MESLLKQQQEKLANMVQFKTQNKRKFEMGVTDDYNSFKFFKYNRAINKANLRNVKKSLQKRGQIMPVLITKDFKVIDGQHRVVALQELELPIHYTICFDYIANDVEEVNNVGKNWDIRARVNNLAEHGDQNCIRLLEMYKEWGRIFSEGTINDAFTRLRGHSSGAIRSKTYIIDEEFGNEVLSNAFTMGEVVNKATQSKFIRALKVAMLDNDHFDINILRANAEKRRLNIYNNEGETLTEIIEVYNYFQRDNKRIK